MHRQTHHALFVNQPQDLLHQTHLHMTSRPQQQHLSPFTKFYTNIRKSTVQIKDYSPKESTDTTSNKQDLVSDLRKTITRSKSGNKAKSSAFNLDDIGSEEQFVQRYQKDPIFRFRVERLMKDVQKKAVKNPRLKRAILNQRDLLSSTETQQNQDNIRTTFNEQKVHTDVLLKKCIAVYRSLITQTFFATQANYNSCKP